MKASSRSWKKYLQAGHKIRCHNANKSTVCLVSIMLQLIRVILSHYPYCSPAPWTSHTPEAWCFHPGLTLVPWGATNYYFSKYFYMGNVGFCFLVIYCLFKHLNLPGLFFGNSLFWICIQKYIWLWVHFNQWRFWACIPDPGHLKKPDKSAFCKWHQVPWLSPCILHKPPYTLNWFQYALHQSHVPGKPQEAYMVCQVHMMKRCRRPQCSMVPAFRCSH